MGVGEGRQRGITQTKGNEYGINWAGFWIFVAAPNMCFLLAVITTSTSSGKDSADRLMRPFSQTLCAQNRWIRTLGLMAGTACQDLFDIPSTRGAALIIPALPTPPSIPRAWNSRHHVQEQPLLWPQPRAGSSPTQLLPPSLLSLINSVLIDLGTASPQHHLHNLSNDTSNLRD